MFKGIAGKGHPEFSTGAQQDAMEFWQHVVERLSRSARQFQHPDPASLFSWERESRSECNSSQKVRYTYTPELHVSVIPDEGDAVNIDAYAAYCAGRESAEREAEASGKVKRGGAGRRRERVGRKRRTPLT
jgi:ubiquitin carboxyl-terminal hydrolase 5/13